MCFFKFRLVSLIFVLNFPFFITQDLFAQGLILDDMEYEQQPRQPQYNEGSKAEENALKGIYKVDLKPYCPEPQDQGLISSCSGWASGYGALTILHAIHKNWAGKKEEITKSAFSALFIYNQIKKGSCDFGAYLSDAAKLLQDKGDILSSSFDKLKNNCDKLPTDTDLDQAGSYRIKDYMTLFASNDNANIKIQKTKLSLAQNKPVVIGMVLRNNFSRIKASDEYWFPERGDTSTFGGHAMVVVGFDDGKEAFEIMNSWGTNWGNEGFIWIKYKDFGNFCKYGYQFIFEATTPISKTYHLAVQLRKPVYDERDALSFLQEEVALETNYYQLKNRNLNRGDFLQPFIETAASGTYLYVFSYDVKGKIKVHWPRDEHLDSKFEGKNESAIITVDKINLAIPGTYGALQFNTIGTEYICVLLARQPIAKLNNYLSKLSTLPKAAFINNLYKAFGTALEPLKNINYTENNIGFSNKMTSGQILPLVIKIDTN